MVTDSNELLGQVLGTCTVQRLLGRGGMGAVYLARQSRPRRTVAVKVLLPGIMLEQRPRNEFLTRFRREADAIAALDHVNIMPVYEYSEQGDIAYLVMPYVTGGTLRDRLEKRNILSLEDVVPIIEQAAAGLDSAHSLGIVHRDLKPGNILFHADGRILLADFGLAKVIKDVTDQETSHGHLTSIGAIVGTPEYLSPEQGTGNSVDYRTDVYSLGIVLYQMLAGRVPFTGTSPVAVAIKHTLEQAPPITRFNSSIPKGVEAVVMKAISKKPEQRYASAGAFATALHQAVAEALGENFVRIEAGHHHTSPIVKELIQAEKTASDELLPTPETPDIIPQDQPSMSTMLMRPDIDEFAAAETVATRPATQQDRVPALPTVITDAGATLAEQTSVQQTTPGQQPEAPDSVNTPPPPSTVIEQARADVPVVSPLPILSHQARYAENVVQPALIQQKILEPAFVKPRQKPRLMIIVGAVLVCFVILGSITTLVLRNANAPAHPGGNQGDASKPTLIKTATPVTAPTTTSTTTNTHPGGSASLPQAAVPNPGSLLYGTNLPGTCGNTKGATWEKIGNIKENCDGQEYQLTNNDSNGNLAGAFVKKFPGGSLPSSYVVQVQLDKPVSSPFNVFINSGIAIDIDLQAQQWNSYHYPPDGQGSSYYNQGFVQSNVQAPYTVDILVSGENFNVYVNNNYQGSGNYDYSDVQSGIVGISPDPGTTLSIKNLTIYTLPDGLPN